MPDFTASPRLAKYNHRYFPFIFIRRSRFESKFLYLRYSHRYSIRDFSTFFTSKKCAPEGRDFAIRERLRRLLSRTFTAYQRLVQFSRLYATRKRKEKKVQCWLPEPNADGARTRVLSRTKNGTLFRGRQRVTVVKGWQDQSAQKQWSHEVAKSNGEMGHWKTQGEDYVGWRSISCTDSSKAISSLRNVTFLPRFAVGLA